MHGFTSNDVKKVNLEVRKGILMAEALFTSNDVQCKKRVRDTTRYFDGRCMVLRRTMSKKVNLEVRKGFFFGRGIVSLLTM